MPTPTRSYSRWVVWGIALVAIIALGTLALFAFRKTTITVTPRSQTVTFDASTTYTAYPEVSAASGTLAYTVKTVDLEDSEVVPTQGTEHVDVKASGTITVFNDYSAAPVKLLKNTRFATPSGLIFKAPDQVVVPGKSGSKPGQVSITVFADQAGESYNVAPTAKFTLPGLQSSAAMYQGVYARSDAPMIGGFSGDRPAAAPGAMETAQASVRSRLESQARTAAQSNASVTTLSDLTKITYVDEPQTIEAGGGVRIHEKAHVEIPQILSGALAQTVAQGVAANAEGMSLALVPGAGFTIHLSNATSTTLGSSPIQFSFTGVAQLVWNVDTAALASALAGRDSGAFQTIVNGFPGVQEAHARIEPFWKGTFPANATDIVVTVNPPAAK